jgi:hypothetical protein
MGDVGVEGELDCAVGGAIIRAMVDSWMLGPLLLLLPPPEAC